MSSSSTRSFGGLLLLLLAGRRPPAVEGFAVATSARTGSPGIRATSSDVAQACAERCITRSFGFPKGGSSSSSSRSSCMILEASQDGGSGGVEGQGRRWDEWETERGGGGTDGGPHDDTLPDVTSRDWREFRKNLISRYGDNNGKDPWGDGCWAHDIGTVEPGSLLIATEEIDSGIFHQSVILILSHERDRGTLGLILNRPGPQRLHTLPGLQTDLAQVFADSQVFDGGPMGLGTMTVLHDAEVEGSDFVLSGVFAGGFDSLIEATRQGRVSKDRVRFVHGHSAWAPGQLHDELEHNQWFVAAAAPELITEHCDQPFNQLWGKLLRLMGGEYRAVAMRNEPRL